MVMDVMHGGGDARDTCRVTLLSQHAVTRAEARDPPTQTEIIDPHRTEQVNMRRCSTSDVQRVGGWEALKSRREAVVMADKGPISDQLYR